MIICSESYTTSTSIIGEKVIKTLYYYLQVLLVKNKKHFVGKKLGQQS